MENRDEEQPAILGGQPIRPEGEPTWPINDPAVSDVFAELAQSGAWGQYEGPFCEELERRLAEWHGADYVRLTASGTSAVEFALRGVGVRAGDEVVLAGWDFKANFVNITSLEANPVLVDVRQDNAQLEVAEVAAAITPQTRAVLASHLHGQVVDMPALRRVADEKNVAIVEDACQMPLADVHGKVAGTWGDVGTLSFGGSKTLTAGRGGAVVTNNAAMAQRWQLHDWRGNRLSPLSEMQAAVLIPQLDRFHERWHRRCEAAIWFREAFADQPGLLPFPSPPSDSDYYKLPFWYDASAFGGLNRERFCEAAHAEGVTLSPSFPALHETHSARRFRTAGALENSSKAGREIVVLHHPVLLEIESEWVRVCEAIDKIRRHATELMES